MSEQRFTDRDGRHRAALETACDAITDGILVVDMAGAVVFVNDAMARFGGFDSPEALRAATSSVPEEPARFELHTADGALLPPEEWPITRVLRGKPVRELDLEARRLDGAEPRWFTYDAQPVRDAAGSQVLAVVVARDITARKLTEERLRDDAARARAALRAEAELAIVTRLYAVLSRVNETIVRTRDERTLYDEVCRIVAGEGGFPLVWVGLVQGREVVPAASAGSAVEYLRDVKVELDGDLGQGPTGTAIREDHPVINDDFERNPVTWPWRAATQRYGLRASAAFPFHRGGAPIGAITFYAATAGAFTAKQVRLLESLCADVSYALDAIDQERRRTEAERALRESEQNLREADRRKDEFLSMLSHELRNPLAPIRNSVCVLGQAAAGSEQAVRARTVIERQVGHLTRLVDDLLDVTRISRGKIQLRRERIDLREVVLRAADDFRVAMEERGIVYHLAVPPARMWVDADPTRIAQVVGNLLHNAAKFSRRGDAVTLSLGASDGAGELSVRDTGVGIEPSLLPRLFEPFVQGERTLARTEGGLGLGLALVKGIVELHGGTVRAESAGTGQGAALTVRLPLLEGAAADARNRAASPRGPGRRILVVDDNADAADSLADLLRIAGHTVDVAYDGPGALEQARARRPDVIVCDIGLPGMSGFDVAREVRRDAALSGARLVALSGYAQADDRQRAREAGFDGHVAKPADFDELLAVVARGG